MTDGENDRTVAACSLEPREQASRRDRWLRLADRSLVSKGATPRGARLVYRSGADVETELTELAAAERECCGFAEWRVGNLPEGLVALDVSADPENVPVIQSMFELARGSSARILALQ